MPFRHVYIASVKLTHKLYKNGHFPIAKIRKMAVDKMAEGVNGQRRRFCYSLGWAALILPSIGAI